MSYVLYSAADEEFRQRAPSTPDFGEVVIQQARTGDVLLKGWDLQDDRWVADTTRAGSIIRPDSTREVVNHLRQYVDDVYVETSVHP